MRFLCGVVCSLVLWGCESDVDLCGGGSVCGVDGNPYASYCAAGEADVEVAYAGRCNDECSDVTCRVDCQYGFIVEDGCPICECAAPPACTDDSPCTRGDVCVDGRCAPPIDDDAGTDASFDAAVDVGDGCPEGQSKCDGVCVDLGTLDDCTECGDVCNVPEDPHAVATCIRTTGCDTQCIDGYDDCDEDGVCEPLDTKEHCGACGNTCARFGSCNLDTDMMTHVCTCPAGRVDCDGTCVNTNTDGEFCGACDTTPCLAGTRCQEGSCTDEGGEACTNPANWDCAEGPDICAVDCGDVFFYGDPSDGSFTCEGGGAAVSCFVPPVANCVSCIDIAARCCFEG